MSRPTIHGSTVVVLAAAAFAAGLWCRPNSLLEASAQPTAPQERGSGAPITPDPSSTSAGQPTVAEPPLVYEADGGQTAAGDGLIAVTGSYGVGTSVLYVLDTRNRQLAVYEARGGSQSGRRLTLVGARRIDLDLKLEGYNDESEYSYRKLRDEFAREAERDSSGASESAAPASRAGAPAAGIQPAAGGKTPGGG